MFYHDYKNACEQIADAAKQVPKPERADFIFNEVQSHRFVTHPRRALAVLQHSNYLELAEERLGRDIFKAASSFEELAQELAPHAMYYDCMEEYGHEWMRSVQRSEERVSVLPTRA